MSASSTDISHIHDFLLCSTPDAWAAAAAQPDNLPMLLSDHANCELKAAQTAQQVMWKYGVGKGGEASTGQLDEVELLNKMSRLSREELRHFEQVIAIMAARNIPYLDVTAAGYAAGLRKNVRTSEPGRLVDILIVGAIIEARSCERFAKLAPLLDDELSKFYLSLLKSEARHYMDYLTLAEQTANGESIDERVAAFLQCEKELVLSSDTELRFHSGVVDF